MDAMAQFVLLAQQAADKVADQPARDPGGAGSLFPMLFPMVAIFVLFYFMMLRPQRREQKQRELMLAALKKDDKVVTIGGIMGTVANLSDDGKEVTVKVDDNTRIRFLRSAIQTVVAPKTGT